MLWYSERQSHDDFLNDKVLDYETQGSDPMALYEILL